MLSEKYECSFLKCPALPRIRKADRLDGLIAALMFVPGCKLMTG